MDNLEDFLKGSEPEAIEPETVEVAETPVEAVEPQAEEPKAERPRGPDGKFLPKGETQPEAEQSASPAPQEPTLEHPALLGERRRRQEAEDRIRALEEQIRSAQQPAAPQAAPQTPTDFWEDPEGYIRTEAAKLAAEQARTIVQGELLSRSMNRVRGKYEDFNEAAQVFGQMIQTNPDLYDRMLNADEPAEFAYSQAKEQMELTQYGSLSALIEARVQAALAASVPAPVATAPIPETLADSQSARASSAPFVVPSLDDILRR